MATLKQAVEQLLDKLPDNSSVEDIQYHLYVLEKGRRGLKTRVSMERFPKRKWRADLANGSPKSIGHRGQCATWKQSRPISLDSPAYASIVVRNIVGRVKTLA